MHQPPSFHTRIRNKLDIPSESDFKSAYSAVKATKQLDSSSKTHIIEVLNCSMRTPKLLQLTKTQHDDTCQICPVIANSTHIAFLNTYYQNSDITPTNFQFFIPSKKIGSQFNSQFLHLLAFLSRLAFSIPFEPPDKVMYWSSTVFYAKIKATFNMIEKLLSFFIEGFDTIDDYTVNGSISHFRF